MTTNPTNDDCTCGGRLPEIGGTEHRPGCGQPEPFDVSSRLLTAATLARWTRMSDNDAGSPITRSDKYNIVVNGVTVRADQETEARIRALSVEQRAAFERIFGGGDQ